MASLAFVKKLTPWFGAVAGAAATGNPAGLLAFVAQQIGGVVGKEIKPTADAITAAIEGATPDQQIAIKKLDQDFAVTMQAQGFQNEQELERIFAGDRADARAMQMNTKSVVPGGLAGLVTLGFFGVLAFMLFRPVPDRAHDALLLMLGSLGAAWTAIIAYYFGSSAGSDRKTEILAQNGNGASH